MQVFTDANYRFTEHTLLKTQVPSISIARHTANKMFSVMPSPALGKSNRLKYDIELLL